MSFCVFCTAEVDMGSGPPGMRPMRALRVMLHDGQHYEYACSHECAREYAKLRVNPVPAEGERTDAAEERKIHDENGSLIPDAVLPPYPSSWICPERWIVPREWPECSHGHPRPPAPDSPTQGEDSIFADDAGPICSSCGKPIPSGIFYREKKPICVNCFNAPTPPAPAERVRLHILPGANRPEVCRAHTLIPAKVGCQNWEHVEATFIREPAGKGRP